jgi:hypothetical protein
MNLGQWYASSPCPLAAALRAFSNYGLSLSGMIGVVPVLIEAKVHAGGPMVPAGSGEGRMVRR